jgi:micrococcal nuclease
MLSLKQQDNPQVLPERWNIGMDKRHAAVYIGLALVAGFALGFMAARFLAREGGGDRPADLSASQAEAAEQPAAPSEGPIGPFRVTRVLRADTVEVETAGVVRMVGIETPDGKTPVEIYGPHGRQALAFTESSLLNQPVMLQFDEAFADRENKDDQGNTLAYIFTRDGTLFNGEIIRRGLGFVSATEQFRLIEDFRALERSAVQAMAGVWASPGSSALAASTPAAAADTGTPAPGPAQQDNKPKRLTPLLPSEIGPNIPSVSSSTPAPVSSEPTVLVSTGDRIYHKAGCEYLEKKRQSIPLSQAKSNGYTACGRCFASTVLKAP